MGKRLLSFVAVLGLLLAAAPSAGAAERHASLDDAGYVFADQDGTGDAVVQISFKKHRVCFDIDLTNVDGDIDEIDIAPTNADLTTTGLAIARAVIDPALPAGSDVDNLCTTKAMNKHGEEVRISKKKLRKLAAHPEKFALFVYTDSFPVYAVAGHLAKPD